MNKVFEFMEDMELPDEQFYQDQQKAIEQEVWADIEADAEYTGATAEDCAALYSNWVKRYRGVHHRPELKL